MVKIQFDIEFQWRMFLQRYEVIGYTEDELSEYKRFFMGGMDQMFLLLNVDLRKVTDLERILIINKLGKQFTAYWDREVEND